MPLMKEDIPAKALSLGMLSAIIDICGNFCTNSTKRRRKIS